jgi:hypothetical protein
LTSASARESFGEYSIPSFSLKATSYTRETYFETLIATSFFIVQSLACLGDSFPQSLVSERFINHTWILDGSVEPRSIGTEINGSIQGLRKIGALAEFYNENHRQALSVLEDEERI